MYGDFQKEAKDYRPEGAVRPPGQRWGHLHNIAGPKYRLLYRIAQPEYEAALHDNRRPDNVIPGRNQKSIGRTSCDGGLKTFGESVKTARRKVPITEAEEKLSLQQVHIRQRPLYRETGAGVSFFVGSLGGCQQASWNR